MEPSIAKEEGLREDDGFWFHYITWVAALLKNNKNIQRK